MQLNNVLATTQSTFYIILIESQFLIPLCVYNNCIDIIIRTGVSLDRSHINIQNPIYSNFISLYVHDTKGTLRLVPLCQDARSGGNSDSILETKKRGQIDHTIAEATHITREKGVDQLEKHRNAKGLWRNKGKHHEYISQVFRVSTAKREKSESMTGQRRAK